MNIKEKTMWGNYKTEPTAQQDWEALMVDLKYLKLTPNLVPWKKHVVSIFGTTSAGKVCFFFFFHFFFVKHEKKSLLLLQTCSLSL